MNWIISCYRHTRKMLHLLQPASPPPLEGGTYGQRDHSDLGCKAVDPVGLILVTHVPLTFYSKTHKFIFSMLSFTPLIPWAPLFLESTGIQAQTVLSFSSDYSLRRRSAIFHLSHRQPCLSFVPSNVAAGAKQDGLTFSPREQEVHIHK